MGRSARWIACDRRRDGELGRSSFRREERLMNAKAIEKAISNQFGLESAPTLLALKEAGPPIAFTRLRATGELRGPTLSGAILA
jgi:hypothetical protein